MESLALGGEVVTLAGGLVLEDGRRIGAVSLRPLSGREEDWLARHPKGPSAAVVSHLLATCLRAPDAALASAEVARRLLVGDRDYLMVQLRRLTLGDAVAAVYPCPACGERMDVTLDLAEAPVEAVPQTAASYDCELPGARTVRFRLPTGADQEAVLGLEGAAAVEALFARCLLDDGGEPPSAAEREAVIAEMERQAPRVEIELDLVCPECGHAFVTPFDPTPFFFAEVRLSHAGLLREVHHLAFHYGWSEADILAMDRTRRRTYLSLLSDELRRE